MFVFDAKDNTINLKGIRAIDIWHFEYEFEDRCVRFTFSKGEPCFITCKDMEHAKTVLRKIQDCIMGGRPWCKLTAEDTGMEED